MTLPLRTGSLFLNSKCLCHLSLQTEAEAWSGTEITEENMQPQEDLILFSLLKLQENSPKIYITPEKNSRRGKRFIAKIESLLCDTSYRIPTLKAFKFAHWP